MPKTDPRKASQPQEKQASQPQALNTAQSVQSEVVAVTQQLASDVSADAYAIGQQSAEYVNQQAFTAFLQGFNEGGGESHQPFLTATPTALSVEAETSEPTFHEWFDEYGTARTLPTVRVIVTPTVWQKAIACLLAVGCILLTLNLLVTILSQSSPCSRLSSGCPRTNPVSSAET